MWRAKAGKGWPMAARFTALAGAQLLFELLCLVAENRLSEA